MKKVILIACTLALSFTSCNIEESAENIISSTIPAVEREVNEDFIIEASQLSEPGEVSETRTIDITEAQERINQASSSSANIENITFKDLEITLAEGSEQTNFDFLDNLTVAFSFSDSDSPLLIDFGNIEKGATSLTLPEDTNTSILDLINETESNELNIDLDLVTNQSFENTLVLELTSTLLAEVGINL